MILKNREVALALLDNLGGIENIKGIKECACRIRFRLKNAALTKEEGIKRINGIIGIVEADNLYYIVLEEGLKTKVFNEIMKVNSKLNIDGDLDEDKKGGVINKTLAKKENKVKKGLIQKIRDIFKGAPK